MAHSSRSPTFVCSLLLVLFIALVYPSPAMAAYSVSKKSSRYFTNCAHNTAAYLRETVAQRRQKQRNAREAQESFDRLYALYIESGENSPIREEVVEAKKMVALRKKELDEFEVTAWKSKTGRSIALACLEGAAQFQHFLQHGVLDLNEAEEEELQKMLNSGNKKGQSLDQSRFSKRLAQKYQEKKLNQKRQAEEEAIIREAEAQLRVSFTTKLIRDVVRYTKKCWLKFTMEVFPAAFVFEQVLCGVGEYYIGDVYFHGLVLPWMETNAPDAYRWVRASIDPTTPLSAKDYHSAEAASRRGWRHTAWVFAVAITVLLLSTALFPIIFSVIFIRDVVGEVLLSRFLCQTLLQMETPPLHQHWTERATLYAFSLSKDPVGVWHSIQARTIELAGAAFQNVYLVLESALNLDEKMDRNDELICIKLVLLLIPVTFVVLLCAKKALQAVLILLW